MTVTIRYIARVADIVDEFSVVVNRGSDDGVKLGDKFQIFSMGQEIFDPDDGASLGKLEIVKGIGSVVHVQQKMCTIRSLKKRSVGSQVRKTTKPGVAVSAAIAALYGTQTVEETISPELIEEPFEAVLRGDYARPV